MIRLAVLALLFATAAAALPGVATAREFAPVDRPGPPLRFPAAQLDAAVKCDPGASTAKYAPVLMTAGTTVTTADNFGWNWMTALRANGFPVCTVDQPGKAANNMEDIQLRGEFVVHAIRTAYELGGRRPIGIVGHSQGGQVMRWALRFWPDTRPMVADVVAAAPTNHGSAVVRAVCTPSCAPALWQQTDTSDYIKALNSGQETFAGISYTNFYTRLDQFVQPNLDDTGTSSLRTGDGRIANVAIQDVCPAATSEHLFVGTADPVGWALGLDALTHDGPADEERIDQSAVCSQQLMPGVSPSTFMGDFGRAGATVASQLVAADRVAEEPPLQCYVFVDCATAAPAPAQLQQAPAPRRAACTRSLRRVALPRDAVSARQDGRRLRVTRTKGRRTVLVRFTGARTSVRLSVVRRTAAGRLIRRAVSVRRCG